MSAVDLSPLAAYRLPCDQLLCGVVAHNVPAILKAVEVRDRLERVVDSLKRPDVNEDDLWRDVYEAAGAEALDLALSIVLDESVPIPARDIALPEVEL